MICRKFEKVGKIRDYKKKVLSDYRFEIGVVVEVSFKVYVFVDDRFFDFFLGICVNGRVYMFEI